MKNITEFTNKDDTYGLLYAKFQVLYKEQKYTILYYILLIR
jgi:hypothetical protein